MWVLGHTSQGFYEIANMLKTLISYRVMTLWVSIPFCKTYWDTLGNTHCHNC